MRIDRALLATLSACAALFFAVAVSALESQPRLFAANGTDLLRGAPPDLNISGLTPGAFVTVRALRTVVNARQMDGATVLDTVHYASWARFRADRAGTVSVDRFKPQAGTWRHADPMGLFWSMERMGIAPDSIVAPGVVLVTLQHRGAEADLMTLQLRPTLVPLVERVVVTGEVAGAFAAPADGKRHPLVLLLHGSEGGDTASARPLARRFAARGYAALAVVYVSYGGQLPGVPTTFDAVPIELLDQARAWAGSQAEADTGRTGIWGASKGAELALIAAAQREWAKVVVAVVPSDVVWAGFGRTPKPGEQLSSWSVAGSPLPAVPYDRYEDVFSGNASAREVHDRSRAKFRGTVAAARIPIERTSARLLLLGAERDELWASGAMSRALRAKLTQAGKGAQVSMVEYAGAGHNISGDGLSPWDRYGEGAFDRRRTARATADAWLRTTRFLSQLLEGRLPTP